MEMLIAILQPMRQHIQGFRPRQTGLKPHLAFQISAWCLLFVFLRLGLPICMLKVKTLSCAFMVIVN